MCERDPVLAASDREVLAATTEKPLPGLTPRRSPGESPMVLAIDLQRHLFGRDVPIPEAVEEYRTAMGEVAYRALDHVLPLLSVARECGVPIAYTRVIPGARSGLTARDVRIVDEATPHEGDLVLDKSYSSAFYGTDLVSRLVRRGVDTVVVLGCSASGCVRSTALDAAELGFAVLTPRECVFDRVQASTAVALVDIDERYGQVWSTADVQAYFREVAA
ncbi:isochorismatase family protein [Halomarina pelagica]|uniref:isochorismatase family protein n=1 Tax=Halomarina pelagica TaxID=2961599 RepID=UPI0020C1C1E6|nr:isochorismatase family protein [Halomarina sp. BND7]